MVKESPVKMAIEQLTIENMGIATGKKFHNQHETAIENSVKYLPPDGLFDIYILLNSISTGAPSRTQLRELTMLPIQPSRLRRIHLPILYLPTPRYLRCRKKGHSAQSLSGLPSCQKLQAPHL